MDFVDRLRRRKLVQWTLAYASVAWVLLQFVGMLSQTYDWPAGVMRALPFVLGAGLLAAIVLAWYHGERGRQRVSPMELLLLTGILLLLGGSLGWLGTRPTGTHALRPGPELSLAVLPFVNVSGDPGQEYFADGVTEEIMVALSQIPALSVAARTSAFHFKNTDQPVHEVARRLGVASVLEGSILRTDSQVRIAARLVDGATDRLVWSNVFDRPLGDMSEIQVEIARSVAAEFRIRLGAGMVTASSTNNTEAHDLYLQGLFHWNRRTGQDLHRAIALFERATEADPSYARAYAGLALAYAVLPLYSHEHSASDALPLVIRAAERASEMDPSLADPHSALGYAYHWLWRWADAEREFQRAIALQPASSTAHQWYGEYLTKVGRADEGIAMSRRAVELDPFSIVANGNLGVVLTIAGRDEESIEQLERTRAMDPSLAFPHTVLHKLYIRAGRFDEALRAGRQWAELSGLAEAADIEHITYALEGRASRVNALTILARWEREPQPLWFDIIFYYIQLHETEHAVAALQRAVDQRALLITTVMNTPWYHPLRGDPRFERITAAMRTP